MNTFLIVCLVLGAALVPQPALAAKNGGTKCAACTLVVSIIEQQAQLKNTTAAKASAQLCTYMPEPINQICGVLQPILGDVVFPLVDAGETPDAVCHSLGLCTRTPGQHMCRLFPPTNRRKAVFGRSNKHATQSETKAFNIHLQDLLRMMPQLDILGKINICTFIPAICNVADHKPAIDYDNDGFATSKVLRGSDWRGKDCDDWDKNVFPGRKSLDADRDENCNGIYGVDSVTGKTYEEEWCAGTNEMGVGILGDSATAHFRIPRGYLNVSMYTPQMFQRVLRNLENELDWPMLSWSTGHEEAGSYAPDIAGPMRSIYSKMVELNRCSHRDFHNIGVNGARVAKLVAWEEVLQRNRTNKAAPVKPILLFMAMIGNDVCDSGMDFTTVEEYHRRVTRAVYEADATLPRGSKVVLVPLANGTLLYDEMHDRIHPIGATNHDVTYADLYDYLNCLEVSPCYGWMNTNATIRQITTDHAFKLSAQLPLIVNQTKNNLTHIEVFYVGNPFAELNKMKLPFPKWNLIEPVDGFHPSQLANSLIADWMWNATVKAGIIPPPNPNNNKIKEKFGDQGGY